MQSIMHRYYALYAVNNASSAYVVDGGNEPLLGYTCIYSEVSYYYNNVDYNK